MMPLLYLTLSLSMISLHLFGAHSLSFDDFSFENAKEMGILSSLRGQSVQVRGFWYPLSIDEGILAPHPQLKSCCLQVPAKIEQQLFVKGKALSLLSSQRVLTVEGVFQIQPSYNLKGELVQFFVLDQAKEVSQASEWNHWALLFGIMFVVFRAENLVGKL